jgi:hypothetical protein
MSECLTDNQRGGRECLSRPHARERTALASAVAYESASMLPLPLSSTRCLAGAALERAPFALHGRIGALTLDGVGDGWWVTKKSASATRRQLSSADGRRAGCAALFAREAASSNSNAKCRTADGMASIGGPAPLYTRLPPHACGGSLHRDETTPLPRVLFRADAVWLSSCSAAEPSACRLPLVAAPS